MTHEEIDRMWQQAMQESIKDGEVYTRYHFAKLVAAKALAQEKALQTLHDENERLGLYKDAYAKQEPVAWQFMNGSSFRKRRPDDFSDLASDGLPYWRPLYTHPPQRTEPVIDKSAAKRIATVLGWMPPKENT